MSELVGFVLLSTFADKVEAEMFCAGLKFLGIDTRIERVKDRSVLEFGRHYEGHVRVLVSEGGVEPARAHLAAWRVARHPG